ncbi:MAG: hypothetical protein ACXVCO_21335 [Ktedonobacterales bacterium]
MGFLDRLLGRRDSSRDRAYEQQQQWQQQRRYQQQQPPQSQQQAQQGQPPADDRPHYDIQPRDRNFTDEQAIERYKYMLRTAPPETIEQAHEEAFAKLTPEQRQMVLHDLIQSAPQHEQAALSNAQDDPQTLARLATRAEVRQPGTLVQVFSGGMPGGYSGMYGGPGYGGYGYGGMGGMFGGIGGSLLGSIAGAFIGTVIADQFFNSFGGFDRDDRDDQGIYYQGDDQNDQSMGYDPSQDPNNVDASTIDYPNDPYAGGNDYGADSGADQGADFGGNDFRGDFGGGDFGGDFGGGDFGGGDMF